MCGNFGLLALPSPVVAAAASADMSAHNRSLHSKSHFTSTDPLDLSINRSMHQVSKLEGIRYRQEVDKDDALVRNREIVRELMQEKDVTTSSKRKYVTLDTNDPFRSSSAPKKEIHEAQPEEDSLMSVLKVLEAQTACTEIRGGQAGGFSIVCYF
jgi:hypothetical protein